MSVILRITVVMVALLFGTFGRLSGQDSLTLSQFEGTWVGLQTWTVENPSAGEPQTVTLTLEVVDGELSGSMVPFLGLARGASITDARIVGNELHAVAAAGRGRGWQGSVDVQFKFTADADAMQGTADLALGDVEWLKFAYDLSRKRSRY